MAFSEELGNRVRKTLSDVDGVTEKRMFGGLAFLVNGNMCCGVIGDDLMVRVGPKAYEAALAQPQTREMDFTGKALKGFVYVLPEGTATDGELGDWVRRGLSFAQILPAKCPRSATNSGGTKMSIRIVRLGTERQAGEGLRIGTVRRPPRGVPKERFSADNWYDLWLPQLAPTTELVKQAQAAESPRDWQAFVRAYEGEMKEPDNARLLTLLAALSHQTDFSVGCYCEDEARCHRSVLRKLLAEHGADLR